MKVFISTLCIAAAALLPIASASAQNWPDRPVTLVVPGSPGGSGDTMVRKLTNYVAEELGQPVVVENKPGASGILGSDYVAKAKADGYTIGMVSAGNPLAAAVRELPYKAEDLMMVTGLGRVPLVLVVRADFPAQNLKEFIDYAKKNPNSVNLATIGKASLQHLLAEMLKKQASIPIRIVHYNGVAPAAQDVLGGHVQGMFETAASAAGRIRSGQVRALAVATTERSATLPNVPTFVESGLPAVIGSSWFAISAPSGTPKPAIDKLQAAFAAALQKPDVVTYWRELGTEGGGDPSDAQTAFWLQEHEQWKAVVKELDVNLN